ncbi:Telomere repeat-binding protein 3 [Striga hermonthica]|uniref:Telomere repeat-binding protein 3 n=1 Tax=Striga hermonthica TaxID=68872 RepID=A0A9N7RN13_STRHE|nr:Telomere repeat-binding protein 3 [Striga hermonthica]
MVSRKRQDYGFRGYRAPVIPRAPRSIRRRGPPKHSFEESKLCAFELLAAVAGKLLQESESSASSNVAGANEKQSISGNGNGKGQLIDDKALKSDSFEHGSCAESAFVPEISIQEQNLLPSFKEKPVSLDVLQKVDCGVQLEEECRFNRNGNSVGGSACFGDSFNINVESGRKMDLGDEKCQIGELSIAKTSNVKEPNEECVNSNLIINSDSSVQLPVYREPIADASLQKQSTDVKLGVRDDDENSYRCKKLSTKVRPFKPQPGTEHRRIRRMMASKYRKVAPKRKGHELFNISEGMKSFYQYRKRIYTREWFQPAPIKKRKLSGNRYSVAYDQDTSSGSISNLPEKGNRTASDTVNDYSKGKDPHVKFSIKSFKVPELYIEVPETASVGSLKRSVMEAVTAILGSGIRVGLLFQGKKVRDDNRTLQQAGISQSNDLDTLGFTLEPCFTHVSSAKAAAKKKLSPVLTCEESPRSPATPVIDSSISNASVDPPPTHLVNKSDDENKDNKRLVSSSLESPDDERMDGGAAAVPEPSNALVALPPMNVGPLAVVPVDSKPKRCDLSQRRTRRPFSVAEVEALVGAVEKLGTGRWRDVKIGAFENADHRTYVDLKDKWKTLVHTASISPHQRRGEPVPQELLDRVLVAHSYWSQHQSKQHGKPPAAEPLKTEDPHREEIVGA